MELINRSLPHWVKIGEWLSPRGRFKIGLRLDVGNRKLRCSMMKSRKLNKEIYNVQFWKNENKSKNRKLYNVQL